MSSTTPERQPCGTCGKPCTVTAAGGIRHHITDNPDFQAGPDSRTCKGAGEPPAGAAPETDADSPQCRLCRHPVQLTANGRARSHLTPEQTPRPCPAGSDFPLGAYPEVVGTTDGLVATLAFDCEHREVGACYDCHAARDCPDHGDPIECTGQAKAGQMQEAVTEAEQFRATPLTEAPERETVGTGTVLDVLPGASMAEQFKGGLSDGELERLKAVVPSVPDTRTPEQEAAATGAPPDSELNRSYIEWRPPHPDGAHCAKCDTDDHKCPGCGTDIAHGVGACDGCTSEANCPTPGTHRAGCGCPDDDPQVRLGDLEIGDHFTRHGTLMRVTGKTTTTIKSAVSGVVRAVVVDGPHAGKDGELTRMDEVVERAPAPVSEKDWRTDADTLSLMSPETRGLNRLRLNCVTCKHPVTPLINTFGLDGRSETVAWNCEPAEQASRMGCDGKHECTPDTALRLGELEDGEFFVRRDVLMRVTGEINGVVQAVVVEGPHADTAGELPNLGETVERTYCRHAYAPMTDEASGEISFICDHCDDETTDEETAPCPTTPTPTAPPRFSATPNPSGPTTAPVRGSNPSMTASAPAVLPESNPVTPSAPTGPAAGNGRSAVATTAATTTTTDQAAAARFLAGPAKSAEDKDRYDGYGRYKLTHPDTGKPVKWTRATTFAKVISDTYALNKYDQRLVLLGTTMQPDLRDRAHGKHVRADKNLLDSLADDLRKAAGGGVAANKGTIIHGFTEAVDHAWHTPAGPRSVLATVPPEYRPIVGTYIRLLEETGLEPIPYLTEFTTAAKQFEIAGTSDNGYKVTKPLTVALRRGEVQLSPGEYVIGDKKSGRSLKFAQREIAIQLAIYAQGVNTSGRFDWGTRTWDPEPLPDGAKVRTDVGLIVHLPVDDEEEDAEMPSVQGVDIESGWSASVLCERARAWNRVKTLGAVTVSGEVPQAPTRDLEPVVSQTTVRPLSLRDKAAAVTSKDEASAVWQEAGKAGLPDAEVDLLVALMRDRLRNLAG